MKKILTFCIAVLTAVTISAREYQHSVGIAAGSGIGAQYKLMITENFTFMDEFGYFLCYRAAGGQWLGGYSGAINQAVLAYQGHITEGEGIKLDFYAGGQIKAGYGSGKYGIIGVGAVGGIEANMKNAPIAFSFDFRPGYACALVPGATPTGQGVGADHMFDWTFNLGVRYTF